MKVVNEKKRTRDLQIRNSTAEFLILSYQAGGDGVDVRVQDGTLWVGQKQMALLFDTSVDNISFHLKNIYGEEELNERATTETFSAVQIEGTREVRRTVKHYNLDAVIAVGYRVNSRRATAFRQWATRVLRNFTLRGYLLDRKRMENGAFLDEDYFERLLEEIREIRLSERRFYQKITDIYATAMDYDSRSPVTKEFFSKVQNKLHFAVHGQTAAEMIYNRADANKEYMGLTTWENSPDGKILKRDVAIAKNYLTGSEMHELSRIVNAYLDLAESRAKRRIPMTMEDWAKRLDIFLQADDRVILSDAGRISSQIAKDRAESEFEKYRIIQDKLFESDFDREIKLLEQQITNEKDEGSSS